MWYLHTLYISFIPHPPPSSFFFAVMSLLADSAHFSATKTREFTKASQSPTEVDRLHTGRTQRSTSFCWRVDNPHHFMGQVFQIMGSIGF